MLALLRPLCQCFVTWLYSWLYTMALYHGFILGFILGFMSLVLQTASCELNPLVQGTRCSADSANLDFPLVMLFRMPLAN